MTSVLRNLQAEWNTLVPQAQSRGIRRVRLLNAPLETIAYRQAKLEWLKAQLQVSTSFETMTFGVEIELILPGGMTMSTLASKISQAGVRCMAESYNHTLRRYWKIVSDASITHGTGCEVVSPPLRGEDGFEQLRKVCQALTEVGCRVNRSCGFHVHIGAANEGINFFRNLVKLYSSAETAIDALVSPSRRASNNQFCASLKNRLSITALGAARNVAEVARSIGQSSVGVRGSGRYCKLNLQSFWQHGTVEFRQHQGTVESQKAENWVKLCLRMCLTAKAGEKEVGTVEELFDAVEATPAEREYFNGRVEFFRTREQRRVA